MSAVRQSLRVENRTSSDGVDYLLPNFLSAETHGWPRAHISTFLYENELEEGKRYLLTLCDCPPSHAHQTRVKIGSRFYDNGDEVFAEDDKEVRIWFVHGYNVSFALQEVLEKV